MVRFQIPTVSRQNLVKSKFYFGQKLWRQTLSEKNVQKNFIMEVAKPWIVTPHIFILILGFGVITLYGQI